MGKTSLSRRFCEGVFSPDFPSVSGVEFQRRLMSVDGAQVQLQVWNSGGEERHPSLLHSYYRASHGVVLVYDITAERSFASLRRWIEEVRHDAPPSVRGVLVGAKVDAARERRAVQAARGAALAAELGWRFYEASAKDDVNVTEAFTALTSDIRARLPVRKAATPPKTKPGAGEGGGGGGGGAVARSNGTPVKSVVDVKGGVRLHELTAPFAAEWHPLINTQMLRLHRELRPHLATTTLASATSYLSLLQTICTMQRGHLLLAFHSSPATSPSPPPKAPSPAPRAPDQPNLSSPRSIPRASSPSTQSSSPPTSPSSATSDLLIGFAIFVEMYDTFNSHRVLLSDLIVSAPHRGQGVGSLMLSYLRQWSVDHGVRYVTAEVRGDLIRCQPLLSRAGLGVQALSFIAFEPRARSVSPPTSPLPTPGVRVSAVDLSNFATQPSTDLLASLEPIYRQLRPSPIQLPPTTPAYLSTLHHILSHGVFLLIAHTADGAALGVAACRRFTTIDHGDRLHVDDLVVDERQRSTGVGRLLMDAVKEEAWGGEDVAHCVVTLESGTQRVDAHRFYWREGLLVQELFWRAELK